MTARPAGSLGTTSAGQGQYQRRYAYDAVGNISSRSELTGPSWITNSYYYSDTAHAHAVTGLSNGWEFGYDDVGNMTERDDGAGNYLQEYNVENRLVTVTVTGTATLSVTQFVYDGNGNRVLTIWPDSTTTAYVGEYYEVEGDVTRSYYWLGGQRIAMRVDDGETSEVYWLHTDHLGSTSLLSTISGTLVISSTTRFLPFGEYRVEPEAGLTDKGFTGHAHNDYIKLIDMKARWYSPQLGRFIQPDTIVPDPANPQSFNRYSYVSNRPIVCRDPSGHCPWCLVVVLGGAAILLSSDSPQPARVLTDYSSRYIEVAQARGIDPVVLAAVVRHESGAVERVFGDLGERVLLNLGDSAFSSIGIAQMQPRLAERLEQAGYIAAQPTLESRIDALFDPETAIDYLGAYLEYMGDQLHAWFAQNQIALDQDTRNRLSILAYNLGWNDAATDYDLLDLLEESNNVGALLDNLLQFGYLTEQVFTDGMIQSIEDILGVDYD